MKLREVKKLTEEEITNYGYHGFRLFNKNGYTIVENRQEFLSSKNTYGKDSGIPPGDLELLRQSIIKRIEKDYDFEINNPRVVIEWEFVNPGWHWYGHDYHSASFNIYIKRK